jgi:UDP:flavonoid glycosyltransferase YjiC (YdhE family)
MKMLLATWDCAGGFTPELTLIGGLAARGHDVHVAAHQSVRTRVERAGATFEHLPNIVDYDSRVPIAPEQERDLIYEGLLFSEAFAHDFSAVARRLQPDVELIDLFLLTSAVAARASGIPIAFLTTTIFKFMEWLGGPYSQHFARLQAFATGLGYELPKTFMDLLGVSPVIASTFRPFELPTTFPPGYFSAGPLRDSASMGGASAFRRRSPEKPLVLVSLSTSYMNQAATLKTLCQAVGMLDVEAVITTSDAIDPQSFEAAANTHVLRYLPHDVILPITRLVVTHAGHGTVMSAVSAGVPMLLLPMGRDQRMVAARAAELGFGAVVDSKGTAVEFAAAIERELADGERPRHCLAFRERLQNHPGLNEAIELVEDLARDSTSGRIG